MTMHTTKGTSGKSYGFVGDADTYVASPAADQISLVVGGTTAVTATSTTVTVPSVVVTSTVDLNGVADALVLDADGNTSISAPTDNQIDIEVNGADDFTFTANTFTALSGSSIATNTIAETTAGSGVTIDGLLIKDGEVQATGSVRAERIGVLSLTGAALQAGVQSWANPTGSRIIVTRAILDVTTVSTAAATVDVGVTEVSATTTSDTLIDGVDVNAATAIFDSADAGLDTGANDMAQGLASGKWVTATSKTGDTTGLVAKVYIYYIVA